VGIVGKELLISFRGLLPTAQTPKTERELTLGIDVVTIEGDGSGIVAGG